jgi:hypothetical protein
MTDSIEIFAKMAAEGKSVGLEKCDFHAAILKRSNAIRQPGESDARAYTRYIVEYDLGKILFKALRAAPGTEVKAPSPAAPRDPEQDFVGRPHAAPMHAMATDLQRANPRLSYESAYARVYAHPANEALRHAVRNEHLAGGYGSCEWLILICPRWRRSPSVEMLQFHVHCAFYCGQRSAAVGLHP